MKRLILIMPLLLIAGCWGEEELPEPEIKRENCVEYWVQSKRLPDDKILMETTKIIYVGYAVKKTEVTYDTLPGLGTEKIQLLDESENLTGDTTVAKEYDIYFTIKGKK